MKHSTASFLLLSATLLWSGCSGDRSANVEPAPVGIDDPGLLAVHDHGEIRVTDLDALLVSLPAARRQPSTKGEAGFTAWISDRLDDLFVRQTLTASPMMEEVEQDESFQRTWASQRRIVLAQAYLQQIEIEAATLAEARRYYDDHPSEFSSAERRLLHNLLLAFPTQATSERKDTICQRAEQLRQELLAGASFEEMALRYSNSSTAAAGGLIGDILKEKLRGDVGELIFSLQPGIVSKVLRNAAGCQIFLVVSVTPAVHNSFETIGGRIVEQLTRRKVADLTTEEARRVAASLGLEVPSWPPEDFDPEDTQRVLFSLGDDSADGQISVRRVLANSRADVPPSIALQQLVRQRLFSAAMVRDHGELVGPLEAAAKSQLALQFQRRRLLSAHLEAVSTQTLEEHYARRKDQFNSETQVEATVYSWPIQPGDPLRSLDRPRAFIRALTEQGDSARDRASTLFAQFANDPGVQTEAIPLRSLRTLLAQRRDLTRALLHDLEEGQAIGPLRSGNRMLVLVIESLVPSRPLSFSEAYDQVVSDYASQEATSLRREWLELFKKEHHYRQSEVNLAQFGDRLVSSLRSGGEPSSDETAPIEPDPAAGSES